MTVKNLVQVDTHTLFTHIISWNINPETGQLRPPRTVFNAGNSRLDFGDGFVVRLDTSGRQITLHEASRNDVDLNFWTGDALLVAVNPDDVPDPSHAVIRIHLPPGVRGVGAFVSGYTQGIPTRTVQTPFIAQLWLRLGGAPQGEFSLPMVKSGINGSVLSTRSPPTAPFVGARALGQAEIAEACFDVSLLGNRRFTHAAISDLWLLRS